MSMSAAVLATGIDKATKMAGNPNSAAAGLRADLTRMLTDHVYLAGVAVFTAYTADGGLDGTAFKAAAGALDENTVELSKAVGSVAGKANEKVFLQVWRSHINDFVTYAKGDGDRRPGAEGQGPGQPRRVPHRLRRLLRQDHRRRTAVRRRRQGAHRPHRDPRRRDRLPQGRADQVVPLNPVPAPPWEWATAPGSREPRQPAPRLPGLAA